MNFRKTLASLLVFAIFSSSGEGFAAVRASKDVSRSAGVRMVPSDVAEKISGLDGFGETTAAPDATDATLTIEAAAVEGSGESLELYRSAGSERAKFAGAAETKTATDAPISIKALVSDRENTSRPAHPLVEKIEQAIQRGLWDSGFKIADSAATHPTAEAARSAPLGSKLGPSTDVRLTQLTEHGMRIGNRLWKERAAGRQPVYFLTPSGYLVPLKGDFSRFARLGLIRIYSTDSKETGPLTLAALANAPSRDSNSSRRDKARKQRKAENPFHYYALELDWLTLDAIEQHAKLLHALDAFESAIRARDGEKDVLDARNRFNATLAQLAASREKWLKRRDALYPRIRKSEQPLIQALLSAVDVRTDYRNWSATGLLAERFANADELLASLYPKYIEDLRRFMPALASMPANQFGDAIFVEPSVMKEMMVSARQSVALRELIEGALTDLDRSFRDSGPGKDPAKAWEKFKELHTQFTNARAPWKKSRDEFFARNPNTKPFLEAVINATDFKKIAGKDLSTNALLARLYPNADKLLEALYPEQIEQLRLTIPDLPRLGVADFESSIFIEPRMVNEFIESRKTLKKEDIKPMGALAHAKFTFLPKEVPSVLERMASGEGRSFKSIAKMVRSFAAKALPRFNRLNTAFDRLNLAISEGKNGDDVRKMLTGLHRMVADRKKDSSNWSKTRGTILAKIHSPQLQYLFTAIMAAFEPAQSLDGMLSKFYRNSDELLGTLYPEQIAELRSLIPNLAKIGIQGFEQSLLISKDGVLQLIGLLRRLDDRARERLFSDVSAIAGIPMVVPFESGKLRPRAEVWEYLLPYQVPGLKNVSDYSDSNDPGYITLSADQAPASQKAKLRHRFELFNELIETNFRVLPIMNELAAKPMPKTAARAIVSEVGAMVKQYEALTKDAGISAEGRSVREKYSALTTGLEKEWADLADSSTLPQRLTDRISEIEPDTNLSDIKNFHTLVNYMHQKSFEALDRGNHGSDDGTFGEISLKNTWQFVDLGNEPLIQDFRLRSKPLNALLRMDRHIGHQFGDKIIVNGNEMWAHAYFGLHTAEIYVKFADPDEGGMLRVRYQEGNNRPLGNPMRLALVKEEMRLLGIHSEVEDPRHLLSILDKDHGLSSEAQLERLFPIVYKAMKDSVDMNLGFEDMGRELCEKTIPGLAKYYVSDGRWDARWDRYNTYNNYVKRQSGAAVEAHRGTVREALDLELRRLGLPPFPEDTVLGQVAIDRYFTKPIQDALARGELRWDENHIPQRQDYRPVESLADSVTANPDRAGETASILRYFESELDYSPIGAVGALAAERAQWSLGNRTLILYGLREPESGALGYAKAQISEPGTELRDLSPTELIALLDDEGLKAPAPEPLSGGQKEMLDRQLKSSWAPSPLSGQQISGLAASAGSGGFTTATVTFDRKGRKGSVLIVPFTEPDDIEAIKKSAAVVTTGGGLLSHAAITTRELGLPSVILPRAEWKKDSKGRVYLELVGYEAAKGSSYNGLNINSQMRSVRVQLKEGDALRVNGTTGEVYVFPRSSQNGIKKLLTWGMNTGGVNSKTVSFAVEETLFNPTHQWSRKELIRDVFLNNATPGIREAAEKHGRRLFEDRLERILAALPNEKEASEASLAAFGRQIDELEDIASLFQFSATVELAPLQGHYADLRDAVEARHDGKILDAYAELAQATEDKDATQTELPVLRKLIRLLERSDDREATADFEKEFRRQEKDLAEQKRLTIAKSAPSVLPLGAVDDDYRILVGGKLSKLGEILAVVRKHGGYVPQAIGVTTEAYKRFMRENNLWGELNALAAEIDLELSKKHVSEQAREKKINELSMQVRDLIRSGKLNPKKGVGREIWQAMQARGLNRTGKELSVRSSAVQEDQADAAFAGAAESYLHVKPEEALKKVIENWASFWLPRGIIYRHQQNIRSTELLPSTIIQEMAEADVAGVLFTQNPVNGEDEIVINAAFGLGEGIVSGIVQTDRFIARKSDGQETRLPFIGDKRVAVRPKTTGSGTEVQGVAKGMRKRRSLTQDQTRRLALIAKALEDHFGYPLDIEFAIQGDKIAILQARPVTVKGETGAARKRNILKAAVVTAAPTTAVSASTFDGYGDWGDFGEWGEYGYFSSGKPTSEQLDKWRELKKKKVVFVCSGNACRSPIAEYFAKDLLKKTGDKSIKVSSRGTNAISGNQMSWDSFYFLKDHGIDGTGHFSTKLTAEDVANNDIILAMDDDNLRAIKDKFPEAKDKTFLLKEFADTGWGSVTNPWPEISRAYEDAARQIKKAVEVVVRDAKSGAKPLHSILFACSFNTSRSPMAEYIAKAELEREGVTGISVISRSVLPRAWVDRYMNWAAIDQLKKDKIDGTAHRSTPISAEDVQKSDVILAMEQSNIDEILARFPEAKDKTFLLRDYAGTTASWDGGSEIENPSKKIWRAYRKAGIEIMDAVDAAFDRISPPTSAVAKAAADGAKFLIVVCSANHSRSPLAERLFKQRLKEAGIDGIKIESRGLNAFAGNGMNRLSADQLDARGIKYDEHFARRLKRRDVERADVLLVMEPEQKADLEKRFPEGIGKTHLLTEFGGQEGPVIDEPKTTEVFDILTEQMEESFPGIVARLKK